MRKLLLLSCLCFAITMAQAQTKTITGKVTDQKSGAPIAGVSVSIKGGTVGTQTKEDGSFSITVPNNTRIITFSSIGYGEIEESIGSSTVMNIALGAGTGKRLDEVVVVAYGTQTKKEATGAVGRVAAADIENRPFTSVDKILQGQVAGLQSVAPSGQPGGIQQVRLRGIGSISASSAPLYVVDGIPINSGDLSRNSTTANALAGINPNDIESVSVLKDAAATSLYGSRAANGVILINTRKGRAGKTRIRLDAEVGINQQAKFGDAAMPLNRDEYFTLLEEGIRNAGGTQADVDNISNAFGKNNGFTSDWFDLVTRNGMQQQYNLSASGGNERTTFFLSGGYFKQEAATIGSEFTRYSVNFNVSHKLNEKLSFGLQANTSFTNMLAPAQAGGFANPVLASLFLRPSQNAYNADGTLNLSNSVFNQTYNPVALVELDEKTTKTTKSIASANLEYRILKDLKFTSRYGIDYNNLEENQYQNPLHGDGRAVNGRGTAFLTRVFNWVWNNQLDYRRYIDADQDIYFEAKLGYEAQESQSYNISTFGENFPATTELTMPIVASTPKQSSAFITDYAFVSTYSALAFNFRDRFVATGTFRRDGSSRFGKNNRYGNFWSVGGSWNLDRENFIMDIGAISQLKLRASYGVNGNATGIGDYASLYVYTYGGGNNYNSQPGSSPGNPGNADLTWEKNKIFDVGVDVGLFQDRLQVTADYYVRTTSDLLLNEPVSRTSGFNTVTRNIGEMENRGVEVTINGVPVRNVNFRWDVSFNTGINKNKITKLNADIFADPFIRRQGLDFQSYYTRGWSGVNATTGAAEWYVDETKGNVTSNINQAGRFLQGKSASPKLFGGFTNTFNFKGVWLEAQLYYNFGNYAYDQWAFITYGDGAFPQVNKGKRQLNRWQKAGDIAAAPKYVYNNGTSSNAVSSRYIYSADYVRLSNITIGYDFNNRLLEKFKVASLRFYVRGSNLFTWVGDKDLPFDPEQGITGINDLQVPIVRTITVGINAGF